MKIVPNSLQRDNQKRLFEALCRISDEKSEEHATGEVSHSMSDHSGFFPVIPGLSQAQLNVSNATTNLCVDTAFSLPAYEHPDTTLAYDGATSSLAEVPMQVDHRGTKIDESPSCAWIPKPMFADMFCSNSAPACSFSDQGSQPQTANATVFAAAITAAMIVDRTESAPKRPRSPNADIEDDDSEDDCYEIANNSEDADDNATEASLDESECALDCMVVSHDVNKSPKAVKDFPQFPLTTTSISKVCNLTDSYLKHASTDQELATETVNTPTISAPTDIMAPADAPNQDSVLPELPVGVDAQRGLMLSRKRRAEAMERFRRKKAVRCFGRKVRYQVRKRIATTRPRVNGRFARLVDARVHASSTKD